MTVFYCIQYDENGNLCYRHDCISPWLSNAILSCDISYWAVPGTLED